MSTSHEEAGATPPRAFVNVVWATAVSKFCDFRSFSSSCRASHVSSLRAIATAALAAPKARATYRRGVLRLVLRGRPTGVALRIDVFSETRSGLVLRVRTVRSTSTRVRVKLPSWDHVLLSYEDLFGGRDPSRAARVRHTRSYPPKR